MIETSLVATIGSCAVIITLVVAAAAAAPVVVVAELSLSKLITEQRAVIFAQ